MSAISILISKYGRVKYHTEEGDKQKVNAGAVLLNSGTLKLSASASALIFSNGKYIRLDEAGEHRLSDIVPEGGMQKLNFDTQFNRYLMAAIDLAVHAGDGDAWGELSGSKGSGDGWGELSGSKGSGDGWGELSGSKGSGDGWGELSGSKKSGDGWGELSGSKKSGDGWGELSGSKKSGDGWGELSGSKKSGDGWGDAEGRIVPILPFGKLPAQPVIFQWSQPQVSQSYVLEILDGSGGIVYSGEVKDNWAQVNLKSLPLKVDELYDWRINVPEHSDKTSTRARISITDENTEELLEAKLKGSDAYQIQDPVLTSLMEAVVLEVAEHFFEAHQRYELLRQSFKKNNLVKLMQAAFYLRHQLKPRAEQLFWKENAVRP
ncbi:hypothetical protein [Flavilitoribacter nigricans]|uniref:Uncharacterized protein n=1 Tax=Flavilitoribacter nigricans (strain ATCC 23147 / DSM 23189 / NBRC 102662 / NCIMB 1420 / SS-2) TaxID=1122177 RepID=A0A2D0MZX9_FLAN2|nr:hypothetical protein [Flavilitoribacter nigricans]PHN01676.1 hypothetical protein CRP01_35600 [Flavilitoribacter nigricans DSM 23189 = NBRC 102662]